MNHPLTYLSLLHKIAYLLGAKFDVQARDDSWQKIEDCNVYNSDRIRVRPGSEPIVEKAEKFISENFFELVYRYEWMDKHHETTYLVPNMNYNEEPILLPFGFGIFVNRQAELLAAQNLITADYKGEIPEMHVLFRKIYETGNFVRGEQVRTTEL